MNFNLLNRVKNVKSFVKHEDEFVYGDISDDLYYKSKILKTNIDGASIFFVQDGLSVIFDISKGYYYLYNDNLFFKDFWLSSKKHIVCGAFFKLHPSLI